MPHSAASPKLFSLRLIGDTILQNAALPFPEHPSATERQELDQQIKLAAELLIHYGGAGIAANQCAAIAQPYQIIIVGVYHDNAKHVTAVEKRYPGVEFPEARLMINPRLLRRSTEELNFYHGCLSVPGNLRGEMKSPQEITVEYKTINAQGALAKESATLRDLHAVVLQHELNHILYGKTYVDCCIAALKAQDKKALTQALVEAEKNRSTQKDSPDKSNNSQEFYRFIRLGEDGKPELCLDIFNKALQSSVGTETLLGLKKQALR